MIKEKREKWMRILKENNINMLKRVKNIYMMVLEFVK